MDLFAGYNNFSMFNSTPRTNLVHLQEFTQKTINEIEMLQMGFIPDQVGGELFKLVSDSFDLHKSTNSNS